MLNMDKIEKTRWFQKHVGVLIIFTCFFIFLFINVRLLQFLGNSFLWVLLIGYSVVLANTYPKWAQQFYLAGTTFLLLIVLNCVVYFEQNKIFTPWLATLICMLLLLVVGFCHFFLNVKLVHPSKQQFEESQEIRMIWGRLLTLFRTIFCAGALGYGLALLAGYIGMSMSEGNAFYLRVTLSGIVYLAYTVYLIIYLYYLLKIYDSVFLKLETPAVGIDILKRASKWYLLFFVFFLIGGIILEYFRQNWLLFVGNILVSIVYGASLWKLLGVRARASIADECSITDQVNSLVKIGPLNFKYVAINVAVMCLLAAFLIVVSFK